MAQGNSLSLKDLKIKLPAGLTFTPNGDRALERQINSYIDSKDSTIREELRKAAMNVAEKLDKRFNELLKNIGEAPMPEVIKGLTVSKPVLGEFHSTSGLLKATTGYLILFEGVVILRRNGFLHHTLEKKINRTSKGLALEASRADIMETVTISERKRRNAQIWLDIVLFSNSDYSTSVNYGLGKQRYDGLGKQRYDGLGKQGKGWFDKLREEFRAEFIRVIERDYYLIDAGLGLNPNSKDIRYN